MVLQATRLGRKIFGQQVRIYAPSLVAVIELLLDVLSHVRTRDALGNVYEIATQ